MSTQAQIRSIDPVAPPDWAERTDLTLDDIDRLARSGAFTDDVRQHELLDGRLVAMASRARGCAY